jgi:hypothetical protein
VCWGVEITKNEGSYKTPFLIADNNRKNLEGMEHVLRMDQSRLAERIMKVSQKEEKVGRSKWRWVYDVESYK